MTNEEKAAEYDRLLREHDRKSTKVSSLQNKIDQTREDKEKIKELKMEMAQIQRKANNLHSM
ncbi:hypothetical protein N9966_00320 [bacterium]|jgi:hypothetical protein|nr:hypothetical protein [bacterium]